MVYIFINNTWQSETKYLTTPTKINMLYNLFWLSFLICSLPLLNIATLFYLFIFTTFYAMQSVAQTQNSFNFYCHYHRY